jgi:pimeloyl-ACP methyl ester carboxylesterase
MGRTVFFLVFLMLAGWNGSSAQDLLTYQNKPIKTRREWAQKRLQILDSMQAVMGNLPDRPKQPPVVQILDSLRETNFTRYTIKMTVADSEDIFAFLYVPVQTKSKKFPAMLALHETDILGKKSVDGQGKNKNLAYARELADRGYVVIAPDYPTFGDSKDYDLKSDRYQSGTMKGIFNHMRCIDFLVSKKEVDKDRIGVIGHSLGGHNALFTGAFDTRLKVVVTSCGWTLFDFYNIGAERSKAYGGRLGPWAQERYMPLLREKYSLDPKKNPFDFDEVISAIAPRAVFSNSPAGDSNFDFNGVKKGIANAGAVFGFLGAPDNLQVRYPESGHDFPASVRFEAYDFIDKILKK